MKEKRIGFIGLGEMGRPMAKNLLKNGFDLTVCGHRRKEPIEELRSLGAAVAATPMEAAESSEVVIIMVRDIPQTDEVFFGKGFWKGCGIWKGIKSGSTVILCSTLNPGYCQDLEVKGREKGVSVLDSPVSGGSPGAKTGNLTFMVGGNRAVFERNMDVFRAMGKMIFYIGGAGMGQAIKLVNNYMMVVTSHGTSEAVRMGLKAGLGMERMMEIIRVSSGNSSVIQNWDMLADEWRERRINEPGSLSLFYKDMMLGVDFAEELGLKADFGRLAIESDDSSLFPTKLGE
ncbi:MAG: NAD(P)-dependent oxidoreductase [Deltaproteobacteria bacterium]|nr:NAD(P)-dependent oxidoreductase [Deltaproteobacteria bacterium]